MTTIPTPEPVAFLVDWPDEPDLGHYFAEEQASTGRSRPLITTTQAEAYADARVRQALEQAAEACTSTMMMNSDSYCGATAHYCADRIRALIK